MSIQSEIDRISGEVSTQTDLIAQIATALEGKAGESSGSTIAEAENGSNLTNNTISLQELLAKVNALPEAETTIPIQSYCNIIAQREGTSGSYGTVAEYAGFNTSDWYPYALKFTTPQFTGNSKSVEFSIHITRGRRNGSYSDKVSFRWALCSSDANFSMYDDTKNDVTEQYQLEKGTIEFTGLTSSGTDNILTIPTTKLTPNATFYLILWGDGSRGYTQDYVTVEPPSNHTASLTYEIAASGGSGVELPELSNPGSAADLLSGKELIDADGNVVTGTIADFDGSYECSGDSTGGSGDSTGGSGAGGSVEMCTGTLVVEAPITGVTIWAVNENLQISTHVLNMMGGTFTAAKGTIIAVAPWSSFSEQSGGCTKCFGAMNGAAFIVTDNFTLTYYG